MFRKILCRVGIEFFKLLRDMWFIFQGTPQNKVEHNRLQLSISKNLSAIVVSIA